MKYLSNISRIHNCRNRFAIDYVVWDIFLCHFLSCGQQLKIRKLPTRESLGPTKYPREKILDPRNTHEKKLGPTKYPGESFLGPRNTHEQKFWPHEIPTSRNFGLTKYPRRHDGAMALNPRDPWWHTTHEFWHNLYWK